MQPNKRKIIESIRIAGAEKTVRLQEWQAYKDDPSFTRLAIHQPIAMTLGMRLIQDGMTTGTIDILHGDGVIRHVHELMIVPPMDGQWFKQERDKAFRAGLEKAAKMIDQAIITGAAAGAGREFILPLQSLAKDLHQAAYTASAPIPSYEDNGQ